MTPLGNRSHTFCSMMITKGVKDPNTIIPTSQLPPVQCLNRSSSLYLIYLAPSVNDHHCVFTGNSWAVSTTFTAVWIKTNEIHRTRIWTWLTITGKMVVLCIAAVWMHPRCLFMPPHQCLINVRVTFANNHGLIHNEEKTNFVSIKPDVLKNMYVPNVEINGKTRELVPEKNSFVSLSMIVFYDDDYI